MKSSKKIVLAIILFMVPLIACDKIARWDVAGTYFHENNDAEFLELKSNGAFFLRESAMGMAGTYEIDGDQITLKTDMGFATRGKVEGNTILDDEGQRWIKK